MRGGGVDAVGGSIGGMRFVEVEGARVSVVGLGCWQFGSSDWGYGNNYARRDAGAIVERALNLGVNLVDTAEIYAYGQSERSEARRFAAGAMTFSSPRSCSSSCHSRRYPQPAHASGRREVNGRGRSR